MNDGGARGRGARHLFGVVAAVIACCLPAVAKGQDPLDTRITSSPPNLHRSSDATFTFEGRAGESEWGACAYDPAVDDYVCAAEFECSLDQAPWTSCTPAVTLRGLADGYHRFAVRTVSGATSDSTPATRLFRVKQTGQECYQAQGALDYAKYLVEDARYGLSIQIEKVREWKRRVRSAVGRDLVRAREQLKDQRERYRKTRRHLRRARSAVGDALARRDAACGG